MDVHSEYPYTHIPSPDRTTQSRSPSPVRYRDISTKLPDWTVKPTFIRRPASPVRRTYGSPVLAPESAKELASADSEEVIVGMEDPKIVQQREYNRCKERFVKRIVVTKKTTDEDLQTLLECFDFDDWIKEKIIAEFQLRLQEGS